MLAGRVIGATATLRDDMEIFADRLMSDGIVDCVYNPLAYAWDVHVAYLEKSATAGAKTILLGMNPGPMEWARWVSHLPPLLLFVI